jgi:predicted HD superfamily hydrolase involved in NAD metabolism
MDGTDLAEITRNVEGFLQKNLSQKRYEHCISTATFAKALATRFNADPDIVFLAALAHDMARELTEAEQIRLCEKANENLKDIPDKSLSPFFLTVANLRHGPAAEIMLREMFHCEIPEILEAVRWHTTGHKDMGLVAKIIYVADKIEPGRRKVDPEFRKECLGLELDEMLQKILKKDIEFTKTKGRVAPETLSLYNKISQ